MREQLYSVVQIAAGYALERGGNMTRDEAEALMARRAQHDKQLAQGILCGECWCRDCYPKEDD